MGDCHQASPPAQQLCFYKPVEVGWLKSKISKNKIYFHFHVTNSLFEVIMRFEMRSEKYVTTSATNLDQSGVIVSCRIQWDS